MNNILYFNPENDIALATDTPGYTPPRAAAILRLSGELLPFWIADDSDVVLVSPGMEQYAVMLCQKFGLKGHPVTDLTDLNKDFSPWGWSRYSAEVYRQHGFSADLLPSDHTLNRLRMLSHRRSSVFINDMILSGHSSFPVESNSVEDALAVINSRGQKSMLKSPWSSSGRGVVRVDGTISDSHISFITSTIRRQGSVMIEKLLNPVQDFASLFHIDNGKVTFVGFSFFFLSHGSSYGGNVIASQEYIRHELLRYVLPEQLDGAVENVKNALKSLMIGTAYSGYAGVDMLIHRRSDDSFAIAPCIELNLRCTMGVIALKTAEHIAPDTPLIMKVAPRKSTYQSIDIGGIPDSPFAITITKNG